MLFDIRDQQKARDTLLRITGVPFDVWERETNHRNERFKYDDDFVDYVIQRHGCYNVRYEDLEFVFSHLTSSDNNCDSIKRHGIVDLREAYETTDSEIRQFLDKHRVYIDTDLAILSYKSREYSISYGRHSLLDSEEEQLCKKIGYRLYRDFCVCGFLSIDESRPYLTRIDQKPEFLMDIGNLIGKAIDQEWACTHHSYEVIAKVPSSNVVCESEQPTDKGKLLCYLCFAFNNAIENISQNVLLCKDGISIPPQDIVEVMPFTGWDEEDSE